MILGEDGGATTREIRDGRISQRGYAVRARERHPQQFSRRGCKVSRRRRFEQRTGGLAFEDGGNVGSQRERVRLLCQQQPFFPAVDGQLEAKPQERDDGHDADDVGRPSSRSAQSIVAGAVERPFQQRLRQGRRQADGFA